jgi:ATP-dependent DNA helicase RecG
VNENLLKELMSLPAETEWVEFKEAKNGCNLDDIGRYFSAISNEANLNKQRFGWLIFGVSNDLPRQLVNSNYRLTPPGLENLKQEIAQHTNHETTFSQIHELHVEGKRVLMFEIPPAARGIPTTWNDTAYCRINDRLRPLTVQKYDALRGQIVNKDWSVEICAGATIQDLEPAAISFARNRYAEKNTSLKHELENWSDLEFLNKSKLTIDGKITRSTIVLLGKPEAVHFLSPCTAKMSWLLRDINGNTIDYAHFGPPFLTAVDGLFSKIRNLTYRYLPDATLFPVEITQYDSWVIREALHNCIAHQDYTLGGQITVIEEDDSLLFSNAGEFLPGSVEAVLRRNAPAAIYRNRFLVDAMVNLGMIDTIGSGIRRMFTKQQKRFFPMPEFDFGTPRQVDVRVYGRVIDEKYTRMLIAHTDFNLFDVVALDKVQKGKSLSDEEFKSLKRQKLVEGRRNNLRVSEQIANVTETVVDYLNRRGIDRKYCRDMVIELLQKQGTAVRSEFESLLLDKLSGGLEEKQKKKFIENLLQQMRREGTIQPVPGRKGPGTTWELVEKP